MSIKYWKPSSPQQVFEFSKRMTYLLGTLLHYLARRGTRPNLFRFTNKICRILTPDSFSDLFLNYSGRRTNQAKISRNIETEFGSGLYKRGSIPDFFMVYDLNFFPRAAAILNLFRYEISGLIVLTVLGFSVTRLTNEPRLPKEKPNRVRKRRRV